ncbi:hypothetical protein [Nevskia soli]|uniref:hypothetical protein n=1 Tax=Nevskia soli TaxID=418856 RepID=UPI0004A764CB|nr:hypothetical protein [Nevskia soli]
MLAFAALASMFCVAAVATTGVVAPAADAIAPPLGFGVAGVFGAGALSSPALRILVAITSVLELSMASAPSCGGGVVGSLLAVLAWRGGLGGSAAGLLPWEAAILDASLVDAAELAGADLPASWAAGADTGGDTGRDGGGFVAEVAAAFAVRVSGMAANASLGGVAFGAVGWAAAAVVACGFDVDADVGAGAGAAALA